jgi:two-component system response regulator AtoC
MSPGLQAKLLQVLQDATFSRLGGNREIHVDVRVICATHRPLIRMVAAGAFREDLYHRLNVVDIQIPPLRERREEIPPLVETFLHRFALKYDKAPRQPSAMLMRALDRYPFPGNIRELENMIKRVIVLETEQPVLDELLAGQRVRRGPSRLAGLIDQLAESAGNVPLKEVGRLAALEAEKETIESILHRTEWNRKKAALLLGVSYKTLLQKIRECELEEPV